MCASFFIEDFKMRRSCFKGIGAYVPKQIVTNADLEKLMETTDEWIVQRTGIKERHWTNSSEGTSDLALQASLEAINNAGIAKEAIDMIIFATLSPDHDFPGSGCFLQAKLGLSNIPALDIRQQCSGFVYGLSIADQYIRSGACQNILLVGAEVHSRGLDKTTRGRDVSILFGDGAGAAIIGACEVNNPATDSFIYSTHIHAEGKYAKELWLPAPGSALGTEERLNNAILAEGLHYPTMNGKRVYVHAVSRMIEVLGEALAHNNLKPDDIDMFFFHQANLRINDTIAEKMNIPAHKVFNTISKYGNTTAATIPIGMRDAISAGVFKKGMLAATATFGSGFTWAGGIFRF